MSRLETNIYPVLNVAELKSKYRLYKIRGLSSDQDEYDHNRQIIVRKLSFKFQSPVEVIERDGQPYLVLRDDAPTAPESMPLVRATAYFDKTDDVLEVDYQKRTPETEPICIRFLQFAIQGTLRDNVDLWLPGAGRPFFLREPILKKDGMNVFLGFSVRVVPTSATGFGVLVEARYRYVSERPLPSKITKEEFRRVKGSNCVYHYGNQWYDVKIHEHSGLSVADYFIDQQGKRISLFDFIMQNSRKPLPREVADLSRDAIALLYQDAREMTKAAPADLCYQVFETDDRRVQAMHRETILPPNKRREHIQCFVQKFLQGLRFGATTVKVGLSGIEAPKKQFLPPDLVFGNNAVLSLRQTVGATQISLDELGRARMSALLDKKAGVFSREPLGRQYLIWPRSVAESYGSAFLADLKGTVNEMFPQEVPYEPIQISYDDSVGRTYVSQGNAILEAVEAAQPQPGYGIVVLHELPGSNGDNEQLAAMVMQELRKRELFVAVIHSTVGRNSYIQPTNKPGQSYRQTDDPKRRGRLKGYLKNVALTKVLLTNERWPFVLGTPLHADLTIGIDVKQSTACFTLMDKTGRSIRTVIKRSSNKERLSRAQVRTIFLETLRQEATFGTDLGSVKTIVIQRDGRIFTSEILGIQDAVKTLRSEHVLGDVSLNLVAIPKSSPAALRFFDVSVQGGGKMIADNPQIGTYFTMGPKDAFICTTGRAFPRPGTTHPLHVQYIQGSMPFEAILEDIFAQSCLTWTRPEDCTRYPITVKLTDIRLREHAGDYDADALEYSTEGEQEATAHE